MTLLSFPSCASGPDNWRQHNTAYTAQQRVDPWPLNWSRAWSIASTRNHAYRRTSQTRLRGVSMSSMSGNQRKKLGGNRGRQRHERISPWCWQATFTQWSAVSKTPKKVNLKNDSHAKARNKKRGPRQRQHRTRENLKLASCDGKWAIHNDHIAHKCMSGCDGWTKEALRDAWVHGQVAE